MRLWGAICAVGDGSQWLSRVELRLCCSVTAVKFCQCRSFELCLQQGGCNQSRFHFEKTHYHLHRDDLALRTDDYKAVPPFLPGERQRQRRHRRGPGLLAGRTEPSARRSPLPGRPLHGDGLGRSGRCDRGGAARQSSEGNAGKATLS